MTFFRRPAFWLLTALGVAEGGLAIVACSAGPSAATSEEADAEAGATPVDARPDTTSIPPDAGREGGNCSGVTGACDIVLQDCPAQQECVVGNAGKTVCRPQQASQSREKGAACCPGAANPCLPGLTCVGTACVDGGPESGRCTPACCRGDDRACGTSMPEGIAGACELGLVDDVGADLYTVCTYRARCKPFGVEPCAGGQACTVGDKTGAASCIDPNGKTLGQPCVYANDCNDGLACLGSGDAGVCRMACLTPGSNHPFDASVELGGPFKGGCAPGATCTIGPIKDRPSWLSFCTFTDGG